jgi:hypothetical protein
MVVSGRIGGNVSQNVDWVVPILANIPVTLTEVVEIVLKVVGVEEEGTSYIAYADVASWKYKLEVVSLTMRSSAHWFTPYSSRLNASKSYPPLFP